jgi:MFS family permease
MVPGTDSRRRVLQGPALENPLMRSTRALDALNFFLADVQDGLGPYLAVYLLTMQHWDQAGTGMVLAIGGLAGLAAQAPAGALVDAVRARRALIAIAAVAVTADCLFTPLWPAFWPVAVMKVISGAAAAVFPAALAAITLGLVGHKAYTRRTGRNQVFNHAGNACAAAAAGGLSLWYGPIVVFGLLGFMAVASLVSVLMIPADAIDNDLARGLDHARDAGTPATPAGWLVLLTCRPLLIFPACVALFHFANAAMLPLVGQKLAQQDLKQGTALMSACIVGAQVVMVPMAALAGRKADAWGRKPLFMAGFVMLGVRGALYTVSSDPYWLLAVQTMDGIGAGLFGALFPIIVADLTHGTGRYNVSLGAVATAQGIGASLSNAVAGFIVIRVGYDAAFLALAAIACAGMTLFWLAMPETGAAPREVPIAAAAD